MPKKHALVLWGESTRQLHISIVCCVFMMYWNALLVPSAHFCRYPHVNFIGGMATQARDPTALARRCASPPRPPSRLLLRPSSPFARRGALVEATAAPHFLSISKAYGLLGPGRGAGRYGAVRVSSQPYRAHTGHRRDESPTNSLKPSTSCNFKTMKQDP